MNDGFGLRRVLTPRSIGVLPVRQPVARPHGGVEIPFVSGFRKRPAPPQHNLPRVEHCRRSLAAIPPVEPGLNRAARELNLEFPIGHAYGARVELRVRRTVGVSRVPHHPSPRSANVGRAGSLHTSQRPRAAFSAATTRAARRAIPLRATRKTPPPGTEAGRTIHGNVMPPSPTTPAQGPNTSSRPATKLDTASGVSNRSTLWDMNCHHTRFFPGCSTQGIQAIS